MDLQISVFLLFILFTAGHSLSCFKCQSVFGSCTQVTCSTEMTSCFSAILTYRGTTLKIKDCAPSVCSSGSIDFGVGNGSFSCCNTNLCNSQDAPDPSTNTSNGKSCYYCDGQDCSKTVNCSGTEDQCFNATVTVGLQPQVITGCVSKSFSTATTLISIVQSVSLCEGNLCNVYNNVTQSTTTQTTTTTTTTTTTKSANSAHSITQSFLFLCCSLLSLILLH